MQGTLNVLFSLQVVHGDVSSAFLSNKMKIALIIVCAFIFFFSLAIIIIYLASGVHIQFLLKFLANKSDPTGTVWYNVNIYVYAGIFLLFSLLYLVFGLKMYVRIRSKAEETGNKKVDTFAVSCSTCAHSNFRLHYYL